MTPTAASPNPVSDQPSLTRRKFLGMGVAGGAVMGLGAPGLLGANSPGKDDIPNPDPGYIGPQFFDQQEEQALMEVMQSGSPFRYWGPGRPQKVQRFEENFAAYMGARYALGVTSGTAALDCAIAALGVGPGDEVILPAYTWWSDYTCILHSGALPVFADIDRTLNLDPKSFEKKITPRTKAVIAVHLLGGPCNLDPILETARKHKLAVVEDCAQCVGGSYRGKKLGSLGDIGIYSFQINKVITSGEGGALVTSNPTLFERAARFHDMGTIRQMFLDRTGQASQMETFAGENFRMSELTGAVLGAQLAKLDTMLAKLRENAGVIYRGLEKIPGLTLRDRPDPQGDIGYSVFFELKDRAARDRCIQALRERKVPASPLGGSVMLPTEESVIHKRTRHPAWPSFNSPEGKSIQYGEACCGPTLEVYDRFVQIRVGVKYTQRINEYIVQAVREVLG